ncbi:hypothetical protein [Mycoplasma struthionis]|uniref:Uncharacterized protein n=1 Tax=Mycoplasma struthionis TaxID=538220 RepID=A0A502M5I3_9MOLU|nr:hypothetical protein [Mycoplasma struthionis]TPI01184.1 hypothetical protein FJM01_03190 [Mycoplasma struthionis]
MLDFEDYKRYYHLDAKKLSYLKNLESLEIKKFMQSFNYINNKFLAPIAFDNHSFNELSVLFLSQAIAKEAFLKNYKTILIATDKSHPFLLKAIKIIENVLAANDIKVINYSEYEAVNESFLIYTVKKIKNFDLAIYLNQYSFEGIFALNIFNSKGKNIENEFIKNVLNNLENLNYGDIKEFQNDNDKIDFEKLINEYTDDCLENTFLKKANKQLSIGFISSQYNMSFIKKIIGRSDIEYQIFNKKIKEDKPEKITFPLIFTKKLAKINYFVKFSFDSKRFFIYYKLKKNRFNITYKLIDINDLILLYILFSNHISSINYENKKLNSVIGTLATKKEAIYNISTKFNLLYKNEFYENLDLSNLNNYLYYDENFNISFYEEKFADFDLFSNLIKIIDMFNYYQTQSMDFNRLYEQNISVYTKNLINYASFDCTLDNLSNFLTKLSAQKDIAALPFSALENLENYQSEKEQYIAKYYFQENENLVIKYSYDLQKVIIICQESFETQGNLFRTFKHYFKYFLKNFSRDFTLNEKINQFEK